MRWFFSLLLLPLVALLVACGADGAGEPDDDASPGKYEVAVASGDLAIGPQRMSFVLIKDGEPVAEEVVYVRFFRLPKGASPELAGESAIPFTPLGAEEEVHEGELSGVYYANVPFDVAGTWGIGVSVGPKYDEAGEVRVQFEVKEKTQAPRPGDKGIAVKNPTADNAPFDQIHTGSIKDDGFHTMTIADAVSSGRPSVIAFATPSFCRTATCGPSLQIVVRASARYVDEVNFLHIEPYELTPAGDLITREDGFPKLGPIAESWKLPSEPWVFVLDEQGTVVARFEGPYAIEELIYALDQVTK
ncbi:MAG: hypothetical protein IT300_03975 [Dehalococcoidia bacterium]|nr:hypothetical protein [Dehalococcoidia bacterium]